MKITSKKHTDHREIVTYEDFYEVRIKIDKGDIITLIVEAEDGSYIGHLGKTPADKKRLSKLHLDQSSELIELLEEMEYD